MIPHSLARSLIHYRTLLVAIANAVITWIVLIIAPLGLFAVITCTTAIFLASLTLGLLGDWALLSLLRSGQITLTPTPPPSSLSTLESSPTSLPQDKTRSLPDQ